MWEHCDGKIKLDITKVSSDFKIVKDNGLILIHPEKMKFSYMGDEKKLRSIIVDENGFILSSAWPKFGNWGEFPNDTEILETALKNNETVYFSHKEDGSLCVRSVINGKVFLRTRGTLYGGEANEDGPSYGERFLSVAKNKYPKLLDPSWETDKSLLFEYVAPNNVVVIKYKEEDLIFLGCVYHDNLTIGRWNYVERLAKEHNLNLVRLHELPREPSELKEEIKMWRDEGVVVRCNEDQTFVKVKSAWYLANHRIKFSMTYDMIVQLLETLNIIGDGKENLFVEELQKLGYDWEIIESAKEFYNRYVKIYNEALKLVEEARDIFIEYQIKYANILFDCEASKRKHFATTVCNKFKSPILTILFNLYDDQEIKIQTLVKKYILTEGNLRSKK